MKFTLQFPVPAKLSGLRLLRSLIAVLAISLCALTGAPRMLASGSKAAGSKATTVAAVPSPSKLVDVNHATLQQLTTLPGIQDEYAAKIVKNRPYANKTQLSSKGVIPAATYRKIRALIIARQ